LHLALSQPSTARFRYRECYLRHFNNGLLSFSSSTLTSTECIQTFSGSPVINLDAKSTLLLKSEHHKAVWSLCLNTLTDRPISELIYTASFRETSSFNSYFMRLTRFPMTVDQFPDYHHVYSFVVTSKNFFSSYPVTTQDTQLCITRSVGVICFAQYLQSNLDWIQNT
jgi:hypothetical protein